MSLPAPDLQSFAVAQEQVTQGAILQPHCERQLGTGVMVHPMRMSLWKKEKEKKKKQKQEEAWADSLRDSLKFTDQLGKAYHNKGNFL